MSYPTRNEDGKVINPSTGNWVTVTYAQTQGFLEEAEETTQAHFEEKAKANMDDRQLLKAEVNSNIDELDMGEEETRELLNQLDSLDQNSATKIREQIEKDGSYDFSQLPTMKQFMNNDPVKPGRSEVPKRNTPSNIQSKPVTRNRRYVRTPSGGMRVVKDDESGE